MTRDMLLLDRPLYRGLYLVLSLGAVCMKNDGGPAFPPPTYADDQQQGMSLRDYFAAAALQSLIPAFSEGKLTPKDETRRVTEELVAEQSYYFADAMLKARES